MIIRLSLLSISQLMTNYSKL